jgi:diacylglycerol kinase family enzyme
MMVCNAADEGIEQQDRVHGWSIIARHGPNRTMRSFPRSHKGSAVAPTLMQGAANCVLRRDPPPGGISHGGQGGESGGALDSAANRAGRRKGTAAVRMGAMSRSLLLLNRGSGGNDRGLDADEVCATVSAAFREAGREIESRIVEPGALDRVLREAVKARPVSLIVAGGDGTVSAAAHHLGGTDIPLGIVPMGTFNLAARDLGVPLDIADAAAFLARAEVHAIDVLDVAGHACLCTTILGFYPEFAKTFERRDHGGRWWKKALKLITALPRTFAESRPVRLEWRGDGPDGRARTKFSAFVPGRYRATTGIVPARTDFASGKLTAYIGRQRHASAALRGMLDYIFGRQEENPELTMFQASALELRARRRRHLSVMIDGEILHLALPLQLSILPGHLRVLTKAENLTAS